MVGGAEFTAACSFESEFVAPESSVAVLPTAHAYEDPRAEIEAARVHFKAMGAEVQALEVYRRPDAADAEMVAAVQSAPVIYVTGGSPMHLRSVLMESPLLDAIIGSFASGTTVIVAAEAASVMCSHMVDSRGGAFTVGTDVVDTLTVIPRFNNWSIDKLHRTIELAPVDLVVVGIPEGCALVRSPDGAWSTRGDGEIEVYRHGRKATLGDLPEALTRN
jgi:cyanophycinase